MFVILKECDRCGTAEERVFTDSWTGKELCLECLTEMAPHIYLSPATEKDNLEKLIEEYQNA